MVTLIDRRVIVPTAQSYSTTRVIFDGWRARAAAEAAVLGGAAKPAPEGPRRISLLKGNLNRKVRRMGVSGHLRTRTMRTRAKSRIRLKKLRSNGFIRASPNTTSSGLTFQHPETHGNRKRISLQKMAKTRSNSMKRVSDCCSSRFVCLFSTDFPFSRSHRAESRTVGPPAARSSQLMSFRSAYRILLC